MRGMDLRCMLNAAHDERRQASFDCGSLCHRSLGSR